MYMDIQWQVEYIIPCGMSVNSYQFTPKQIKARVGSVPDGIMFAKVVIGRQCWHPS
jgi:hypothetical protein